MKTLMQMRQISEQDLPDIYCDMDQVLCNFMKGADAAVGGSFVNTDKDERWNKINQTKGFWANLEWMPGAKRMYQFIEKYDPYILSIFGIPCFKPGVAIPPFRELVPQPTVFLSKTVTLAPFFLSILAAHNPV